MCDKNFIYKPIPTEQNIEYAFERLLLPIVESANYGEYKESHDKYNSILLIIIKWISSYVNTKTLKNIELNEFYEIKQQLFELDNKYLSFNELYAEEAYEWILQLQIIIEKERNCNNGI